MVLVGCKHTCTQKERPSGSAMGVLGGKPLWCLPAPTGWPRPERIFCKLGQMATVHRCLYGKMKLQFSKYVLAFLDNAPKADFVYGYSPQIARYSPELALKK